MLGADYGGFAGGQRVGRLVFCVGRRTLGHVAIRCRRVRSRLRRAFDSRFRTVDQMGGRATSLNTQVIYITRVMALAEAVWRDTWPGATPPGAARVKTRTPPRRFHMPVRHKGRDVIGRVAPERYSNNRPAAPSNSEAGLIPSPTRLMDRPQCRQWTINVSTFPKRPASCRRDARRVLATWPLSTTSDGPRSHTVHLGWRSSEPADSRRCMSCT